MTALLLAAIFVLILLNGFFVAAEFALVRASRGKLAETADTDQGSRVAVAEMDEISEYLSGCQLGITLTSLGIGFLGEPAIAKGLEPLFGGLSHGVAVGISLAIAYLLTTSLHITVGEQVPKIYAISRAERTARFVARPLQLFTRTFRPFVRVLDWASTGLLRIVGIRASAIGEEGGDPDELKRLILQAYTGGKLEENEASMLSGVFHLHEQEARQVMTPIPAVVTVDVAETVRTALERCIDSGHTRLVVTEDDNQDRVKGIVHANALAKMLMDEGADATLESIVRDAPIVPLTKALDDLLADLQRSRTSMSIVVDEYGRTAGIVTVEDIIEEVVGEIDDETDPDRRRRAPASGRRVVRARTCRRQRSAGLRARIARRHRRLQLGRRLRLLAARAPAQARRHHQRGGLRDPRGVGAGEPRRGGPHPRAPRDLTP